MARSPAGVCGRPREDSPVAIGEDGPVARTPRKGALRIGIVCPYDWQVPGGVSVHIRELTESLIARGHRVNVLAPADEGASDLPTWLTPAGKALAVPFNGSVARVRIGLGVTQRTREWIREGRFDVIHIHEPLTPGLSLAASRTTSVPTVGTFHAAAEQGIALAIAGTLLSSVIMRLDKRIVVSGAARETLESMADEDDLPLLDPIEIPNFIDLSRSASGVPRPEFQGADGTLLFLGRTDEPRKGLSVLLEAIPALIEAKPHLRILIAGPGDVDDVVEDIDWHYRHNVSVLGSVDEETKSALFASADIYVAPHLGGESFGIVLIEAMAAGTPVIASNLDAFRQVLDNGRCGILFERGDAQALVAEVLSLLDDKERQRRIADLGLARAAAFDREEVVSRIVSVYEDAIGEAHDEHLHDVAVMRRRRIAGRAVARSRG